MKLRIIIILFTLSVLSPLKAQVKIYIWQEIEPGWKNHSMEYWNAVKGYGKHVPGEMAGLISEYHDLAGKKLELALKERMLVSSLPGVPVITSNPGKELLADNDLFLDLQCRLVEVTDRYPNYRIRKLGVQPVLVYSLVMYNSRAEIVARKEIIDSVDFRTAILPQVRGLSEHRRDIETVRLAYFESFSGSAPDRIIAWMSEMAGKEQERNVASDPGKFREVLGLVFDKRKLQYPEDYRNIRFDAGTSITENKVQGFSSDVPGNPLTESTAELNRLISGSTYHALLIGINDYRDPGLNDLTEPLDDARRFYNTLTGRYTFSEENINFLVNPTREQLVQAFDRLAGVVGEEDNLLIFYAGHGLWDEQLNKGFWIPSDASPTNRSNWFSNSDLRDYIGGIKAKHILLISDACFSGGIFKTREVFSLAAPATIELYKLPSRKAMTSGAMTTVPDKSVFLEYLLKRLDENQNPFLSAEQLFASFKIAVINNSTTRQIPQFGEIRETGDEGGDFLFILKDH